MPISAGASVSEHLLFLISIKLHLPEQHNVPPEPESSLEGVYAGACSVRI